MALPTAPTGPVTWTRVPSANPSVGPALLYASITSGVGSTVFVCAEGGVPVAAIAIDVASITWTALSPSTSPGGALAWAGINSGSSKGVYLLPGGRLHYDV